MVTKRNFLFTLSKLVALRKARELNKPLYKTRKGYFVGSRAQALLRLNIRDLVRGRIKRIILKKLVKRVIKRRLKK